MPKKIKSHKGKVSSFDQEKVCTENCEILTTNVLEDTYYAYLGKSGKLINSLTRVIGDSSGTYGSLIDCTSG